MINELSEGAKISFMGRKETDLERKVRKLEQDMLQLDDILNKEKLVRNKSMECPNPEDEDQKTCSSCPTMQSNYRLFQDHASSMAQGDGPDPWQVVPIRIHRDDTSSQMKSSFFLSWDCTLYDYHNNNAQRSIYTLLDQWRPGGNSISADQFKKQLSALLIANKESASITDLPVDHLGDISSKENITVYKSKSETDVEKPELDSKNTDLGPKKSESDAKEPNLDTRDILANLEKKLKEVEFKCRDDYVKALNPFSVNKSKIEDIDEKSVDETENIENAFIDDLIFEMFQDSPEEFEKKPIELSKEVDDLQDLINSYNEVGDLKFLNIDLKK